MTETLTKKLATLPTTPGVYFHKDAAGHIIYVGKAAVLRNRVRQYFQKSRGRDPKTEALVLEIADTDWIEVDSEIEALFLEAEMIRRYMPRYNILLRDDKAMSYIRIDYDSDHPTVTTTRRPLDDGARYYGPYVSAGSVRQALKILRKIFPFAVRTQTNAQRSTLYYHLGLDPGLEEGKTSLEDYRANLRKLISVIQGKRTQVIRELERDMKQAAKDQDFERAAQLRNQVFALQNLHKQILFSDKENLDLSRDHALNDLAELLHLYDMSPNPQSVRTDGVQGTDEKRTEPYKDTVKGVSEAVTQQSAVTSGSADSSVGRQARRTNPLRRIEGYDISHMSGTDTVASMVVFTNGVSDKSAYRKFKMRVPGNDDFAHMREVLSRRLSDKNVKAWPLPNLFLIDGGKGQLASALQVLQEKDCKRPAIGLAKQFEEIIIKKDWPHVSLDRKKLVKLGGTVLENDEFLSVRLPHTTHIVKLLQRIRDESHRFAVSYHSTLKTKRQTSSLLDDIPTIGPETRKKLLRYFGSYRGIEQARKDELIKLIGEKKTTILRQYLRANKRGAL